MGRGADVAVAEPGADYGFRLDGSDRLPRARTADGLADGGRGLRVVEALAERWGVERRPGGKAVWARTRPCPALVGA